MVNDVTLLDQYDHIQLEVTSLFTEITAPELHYKSNGCYSFTVLLGGEKVTGHFPIIASFKPHQRHPVGQLRNGQKTDHYTSFLGCESLLLKGDYHYHASIAEVC